ncbi:MAG: ferrous iron transport protein A [Verrucomicrobia bacterium]|nr:ferrous iron transport protein A [Verrucomicrobiota bacterium]
MLKLPPVKWFTAVAQHGLPFGLRSSHGQLESRPIMEVCFKDFAPVRMANVEEIVFCSAAIGSGSALVSSAAECADRLLCCGAGILEIAVAHSRFSRFREIVGANPGTIPTQETKYNWQYPCSSKSAASWMLWEVNKCQNSSGPEMIECDQAFCPLSRIKAGTAVRIKQLSMSHENSKRLREIGFCEEQIIRLITSQSNFICQVCNSRLAISAALAQMILVEPVTQRAA